MKNSILILIDVHGGIKSPLSMLAEPHPLPYRGPYMYYKVTNIINTLQYCKKNEIPMVKANYMFDNYGDSPILKDFNFEYDTSRLPNFNFFETVYFAGGSLDQCIYHTRPLSYDNVDHKNKKIILNSCWQGAPDNRILGRHSDDHFNSLEEVVQYTNDFLIKKKINYTSRLV
tara:strand:+ start:14009 stop:14524 length:516 start_codon:yes stop_codon:yes gene_type:complete